METIAIPVWLLWVVGGVGAVVVLALILIIAAVNQVAGGVVDTIEHMARNR